MNSKEFQIKRLGKSDSEMARQLFLIFGKVFARENPTTAGASYLEGLLAKPGFIVYAALHQDEIVGGLTAYELPMYYSESSEMFIYDIAIQPEFQRKGLGTKLLSTLQEYCRQHGIREMFVAASEEDTHAIYFYQSTGGEAEKVVHFTYDVNT